jgi:hypothetical protein
MQHQIRGYTVFLDLSQLTGGQFLVGKTGTQHYCAGDRIGGERGIVINRHAKRASKSLKKT